MNLAILRHPLFHLFAFLAFSYGIKEFYPFTHIPMYSDPEPRAPYLHLADASDAPIGVAAHSGVTNPKMRKMYNSHLREYCESNGLDKDHPTPEAEAAVGRTVIDFLRERSELRNRPLPADVRLYHVQIEPADDGFKETRRLLVESHLSS